MADKKDKKTAAAFDKLTDDTPTEGLPPAPPLPEYELKSYEPVEFTMPHFTVSEEMVDHRIAAIADQMGANYEPTSRKVVGPKENIEMDIVISKEGVEIEGLCSEDRLYTLGEGLMPIEFDRGIVGMKVDEEREFTFQAPDLDDLEALERKETRPFEAKVKVKRIMKKAAPVVDDEWVKKYMPMYKSADQFRLEVRNSLKADRDKAFEQEKLQMAAHTLAERFEGTIDDYFYEATRADLIAQYEQQARQQGMDLEDMLGQQGVDQQQFSMMLMFQVRDMLTQGFSLDAWARHYDITPTEDDMKEMAKMMVPQNKSEEFFEQVMSQEYENDNQNPLFIAARRYLANQDVLKKAKVSFAQEGETEQPAE